MLNPQNVRIFAVQCFTIVLRSSNQSSMATFKLIILPHQRREDGTINIKIRVTHKRRSKYIATPFYASKDDLTRTGKLKNQKFADAVEDMIRRYRERCNQKGEALNAMEVDDVVKLVTADASEERFDLDIIRYARTYIDELRQTGHTGNANAYKIAINSLVKFAGRESISIHEVTVTMLNDWMRWIMEQPPRTGMTKGTRAPGLYLSQLRAIHNRAKREFNDEDAGIIRIPYSPFSKVDVPKAGTPRKRAISVESLRKLAALEDKEILQPGNNRFNFARDMFLLSFLLMGMNAVDLYHVTDCKDGRITYQRTKTKNRRADRAEISIKIEPEAEELVKRYADKSGERVFAFHRMYSSVDSFCQAINKGLKKVGAMIGEEDLEFYAARHTWATIALNEAGVDKYTVHQALNHVDDAMRVTDYYIKRSWAPIDAANRKVIDYVGLSHEHGAEASEQP